MAVLAARLNNFVNLYDFGNAHGRGIYPTFEEFEKAILAHVEANKDIGFYMGVTNSGQSKECKWLHDIGFNQVKVGNLTQHYASYHELVGADVAKLKEEREAAHQAALDARPRNAAGRLLRADGMVIRRPFEYFVGDRIRWQEYNRDTFRYEWKEGAVRTVTGTGYETELSLRTRKVRPSQLYNIELVERAQ